MIFGYTPLDPIVVLAGTLLAIWYIAKDAVRLIGFMPTALSIWFFVPTITNLTLWQIVPLLLTGRALIRRGTRLPQFAEPVIVFLAIFFVLSVVYALVSGAESTRVLIRSLYYIGLFAIFIFACEMGRRPEAYEILLKGLVAMGTIYAAYGVYQIAAFYMGLPVRGIVYNAGGEGIMAFEAGLLRINSFANEPKRLGYVLFLAALACLFLAQMRGVRRAQQLRWTAVGILAVSIMTFAGSYFTAVALFGLGALLVYPSRATAYAVGALVAVAGVAVLFPDLGILDALQYGYDRRIEEIEVGLDGTVVYRQEIFAIDYLANKPVSIFTGVGVGQYYSILSETYGVVAGYDQFGGLRPLNSNLLELIFDLGIVATALIYGGVALLIVQLRRAREVFMCVSLIFLVAQSFSIITLLYIALFAGFAVGRLEGRQGIGRQIVRRASRG